MKRYLRKTSSESLQQANKLQAIIEKQKQRKTYSYNSPADRKQVKMYVPEVLRFPPRSTKIRRPHSRNTFSHKNKRFYKEAENLTNNSRPTTLISITAVYCRPIFPMVVMCTAILRYWMFADSRHFVVKAVIQNGTERISHVQRYI